jgi:hypothetical protein
MSMHLIGVYLKDVYLTGMYLIGTYGRASLYRRASLTGVHLLQKLTICVRNYPALEFAPLISRFSRTKISNSDFRRDLPQ